MTTKHKAEINEFTAISLEWKGNFDLFIYKENIEIYRHSLSCYSLTDLSKIVRKVLNLPRKKINWEVEK